jgi:hypothetical protein
MTAHHSSGRNRLPLADCRQATTCCEPMSCVWVHSWPVVNSAAEIFSAHTDMPLEAPRRYCCDRCHEHLPEIRLELPCREGPRPTAVETTLPQIGRLARAPAPRDAVRIVGGRAL